MYMYFECGDGEIISSVGKCNGIQDCVSGRDEENCNIEGNHDQAMRL